jgi:hypothetical protein
VLKDSLKEADLDSMVTKSFSTFIDRLSLHHKFGSSTPRELLVAIEPLPVVADSFTDVHKHHTQQSSVLEAYHRLKSGIEANSSKFFNCDLI